MKKYKKSFIHANKYVWLIAISMSISGLAVTGCTSTGNNLPCYKGRVVNELGVEPYSCTYVVRIEGGKIGETWEGIENCVHVINLPEEAQKKGAILFFSSFEEAEGIICNGFVNPPPKSIKIINYSLEKCI